MKTKAAIIILLYLTGITFNIAMVIRAESKQRVVAVYQFGCLTDVHKNEKTYVVFPIDEYGREDRAHGTVIAPVVTLPPQGKNGTPAECAFTRIEREDGKQSPRPPERQCPNGNQ